jgi:long-chain acyl-CoA synthetase
LATSIVGGLVFAYLAFVAIRLGLHQRLPLALSRISLERIPDRAATKYGEAVLFTSDQPCTWEVPALRGRYTNPREWSATRIRSTSGYLATLFQDRLDVSRGDRIAVLKENHLDIHVLIAGIVRAGGIACPINGRFAAAKLDAYLRNLGAKVLISDSVTLLRVLEAGGSFGAVLRIVLAEKKADDPSRRQTAIERSLASAHPRIQVVWLEAALEDVRSEAPAARRGADDPVYLVHSSGTTGFPKAVILENGAQSHAVRGWLCYVHVARGVDKGYLAVPNNHQAVILTFNSLLLLGLRVHWTGAYDREGFDAERTVREMAEGEFTGFFGFPITYTQLIEPGQPPGARSLDSRLRGNDRMGRGFGAETNRRAVGHSMGSLDNHSPVPDGPDHPHPLRIWSF